MRDRLVRIGVFYDGNFFNIVSNYYNYHHPISSRLSIRGIHEFIRKRVAREEGMDPRLCQIIDVHYFRGRLSTDEINDVGRLMGERHFDDVLIREGVITHYLPIGPSGTEKGIDVWFALEAYELSIYKRFDVCVLIAGDSDYVPLARKLNTLGTRVMVIGWDFEYTDDAGRTRTTKTSVNLLDEVTYPVLLSSIIEDKSQKEVLREIFLPRREHAPPPVPQPEREASPPLAPSDRPISSPPAPAKERIAPPPPAPSSQGRESLNASQERLPGKIQNIIIRETENKRFGWVTPMTGGDNLWFGERDLEGAEFSSLRIGDSMTYELGSNPEGPCARRVRRAPDDESLPIKELS